MGKSKLLINLLHDVCCTCYVTLTVAYTTNPLPSATEVRTAFVGFAASVTPRISAMSLILLDIMRSPVLQLLQLESH